MSVHFLLGAPGSGKSSELLEGIISHAVANPQKSHLLLVPEQFCLSSQKRLMERHPRHAFTNIEALSFDRLAARVFREFSVEKKEILSETAKLMLIALAMGDCEKKLNIYKKQVGRPAFIRKLSGLFSEWDMNDISPARLREIAGEEELPPILRAKLADFSCLYEAFKKRLGESITAEELLPRFLRLLPASGVGRVDRLYIDGFTGFTSVQYDIISELMRRCPEVFISLTLPEGEDPDHEKTETASLFAFSRSSYRRLVRCAEEAGKKSDYRFSRHAPPREAERVFLRDNLFHHKEKKGWELPPAYISLTFCQDPPAEAAYGAELIRSLCEKGGLRYRDIALVVGDLKEYVPPLKRLFSEMNIPFFTDRRESLASHPLMRLLGDSLEAIRSFDRDPLLRVLKNPCSPLSRPECDRFENYLLAAGLRRGKALTQPFTRLRKRRIGEDKAEYQINAAEEKEEMELLRQRGLAPLISLKERLGGKKKASEAAEALKDYLNELNGRSAGEAPVPGQPLWEEVFDQLILLLDSMAGIMGESTLSLKGFGDMLSVGLENLTQGRLPVSPDSILIGDLERSRFGDIKALIFLGMNEGMVPRAGGGGQLITDRERIALSSFEEDLAYTESRAAEEARYYLYSLLQKPEEHLYLSYSGRGSGEEKTLLPSPVIEEIRQLYPQLETRLYHKKEHISMERAETARDFLSRAPRAGEISASLAEELYGNPLYGSVSSLEGFASCPYSYFLARGLGLAEREEKTWDGRDHGTLFHRLAESLVQHLSVVFGNPSDLDANQKEQIIEEVLAKSRPLIEERDWSSQGEKKYHIRRWRRFFAFYLDYLCEQGLSDGYLPQQEEMSFGYQGEEETIIPLSTAGKMIQLRGKIDRIDIKETEKGSYLRIVDYKTGTGHSFEPGKTVEGTGLQLPLYLDIALRKWNRLKEEEAFKPGGILYAPLAEKPVSWQESEEKLKQELYKEISLTGLSAQEAKGQEPFLPGSKVSCRELELLADYARNKTRQLGDEILSGRIPTRAESDDQYGNCANCSYSMICPFDERNPACHFQDKVLNKKDAWEIIRGEENNA